MIITPFPSNKSSPEQRKPKIEPKLPA